MRHLNGSLEVCTPPSPRAADDSQSFVPAIVSESELVCLLKSLDLKGNPRSRALKEG